MRIDLAAACREALGTWRRDRDVIVAVAGVFFFLPNLALGLFMSTGDPSGAAKPGDQVALLDAIQRYAIDNAHWLALQTVAELVGVGVLLTLLLDPARPTVGTALRTVFVRLPVLIAATLLVNLAKLAGLFLFLIPGLYVVGRVFVVLPVLVAERERRFGDAMSRALTLTHGHVLQLLSISELLYFTAQTIVLLLSATAGVVSSGGGNPVTMAMLAAAVAAVGSGMSIAFSLVRVAVYRRLVSTG